MTALLVGFLAGILAGVLTINTGWAGAIGVTTAVVVAGLARKAGMR
jgi:hypothetical protein